MAGSPYNGDVILLATMHGKEKAIAPAFSRHLGASIEVASLDTDTFGTFSGEVPRRDRADRVAREKCFTALQLSSHRLCLASEGSFGPHPQLPFSSCGHEILYFVDTLRNFEIHEQHLTPKTNYARSVINSEEELEVFAKNSLFPSHALILKSEKGIVKGIQSSQELFRAFRQLHKGAVEAETDMRAHLNPTRMEAISYLAEKLAERLATLCPRCTHPGFGMTGHLDGLPCSDCGAPTQRVAWELHTCKSCSFEKRLPRKDGLTVCGPADCPFCNP